MLRSFFALLMILLTAPACAGSRLGGGFLAFHPTRGLVLGFFGGYFCGYDCGLGFYNPGYGYFNSYGYGYSYGSSNGYGSSNEHGYFNYYGYLNDYVYGNRYEYGNGATNAARISNGLAGGYVPDPVGADIPPMIIPKNCWVRRADYAPSGAFFGQILVNLCRTSERVTVTGLKAATKAPDAGLGVPQPVPIDRKTP